MEENKAHCKHQPVASLFILIQSFKFIKVSVGTKIQQHAHHRSDNETHSNWPNSLFVCLFVICLRNKQMNDSPQRVSAHLHRCEKSLSLAHRVSMRSSSADALYLTKVFWIVYDLFILLDTRTHTTYLWSVCARVKRSDVCLLACLLACLLVELLLATAS